MVAILQTACSIRFVQWISLYFDLNFMTIHTHEYAQCICVKQATRILIDNTFPAMPGYIRPIHCNSA